MHFDILHLSDLHFGNPQGHLKRIDIETSLATLLSGRAPTTYVVISGDITFRGSREGYREATEALRTVLDRANLSAKNVVVCPGNHDLITEGIGRPFFSSFDEWSSGLRSDKECTFANCPVRVLKTDVADFVLINTAYHGSYEFGQVDVRELDRVLLTQLGPLAPDRPRIAVLHHHFVPVLIDDTSTIRNAYEVLGLLQSHGFVLALHGHQHAILSLQLGEHRMQISGVGSYGFNTPGVINSCAVYTIDDKVVKAQRRFGMTMDVKERVVEMTLTRGRW